MTMTIVDYDFGIPVIVHDVEVENIGGHQLVNIDYQSLHNEILRILVKKESRLTGFEVRFIRLALGLNLSDFAKALGVTHAGVKAWEDKGESQTMMALGTETLIRLHGLTALDCTDIDEIQATIRFIPNDGIELSNRPIEVSALICASAWEPVKPNIHAFYNVHSQRPSQEVRIDALATAC